MVRRKLLSEQAISQDALHDDDGRQRLDQLRSMAVEKLQDALNIFFSNAQRMKKSEILRIRRIAVNGDGRVHEIGNVAFVDPRKQRVVLRIVQRVEDFFVQDFTFRQRRRSRLAEVVERVVAISRRRVRRRHLTRLLQRILLSSLSWLGVHRNFYKYFSLV